ncbi:KH domain-containing protein [Cryptosporidium muris RN66]|uniref:KH domain-containing protein n=1 Tax=Cryptosporidium muris (strain RN66) TaxID=441375 RepID=B6AF90_CRYMR|nr:KH domain-containing protein [Cryptosporidium muris RN66]EEA06881.1 KH domain-containing protein [Cryptosporidium muris RN66]|eukprot:XP_002141230.1 KH domain-containing protein [Cryptosporidium muris RN66]
MNSSVTNKEFIKLLISDIAADKLLDNSASLLKDMKYKKKVYILVSGEKKYFPGTCYRVTTIEGTEESIYETVKLLSNILFLNNKKNMFNLKIAIPRNIVGSIIGIKGKFIRSLRVSTNTHINISPIFVTSDKACNERIITILSEDIDKIYNVFLILLRKINEFPNKSCRGILYRRNNLDIKNLESNEEISNNIHNKSIDQSENDSIYDINFGKDNRNKQKVLLNKFNKEFYVINENSRWRNKIGENNIEDDIFDDIPTQDLIIDDTTKIKSIWSLIGYRRKDISTVLSILSTVAAATGFLLFRYLFNQENYLIK